jgi:tryptophan synthase alpha chain
MNRIISTFNSLKADGKKAFVGYLTAGDPDLHRSLSDICTALSEGVDILELGIPFSDPTADGPIIQEASQRALKAGINIPKILQMVEKIREKFPSHPIVLFGYANPIFRYGYATLCRHASKLGVDGLLIVDIPFEEYDEILHEVRKNNLLLIPLIAPTTPEKRAVMILKNAEGFVYYISVTGVTGMRKHLDTQVEKHVYALRRITHLPIVVGFGISSARQASAVARYADGIVVGSALIQSAREGTLKTFVRELRRALDQ